MCLILPIRGLRLHALVCGASPVSRSEYYCCCLHYPPFPSLPLTEQGRSYSWATSTFVGFYCCGEEAIAIERALVAKPETGRWGQGLQMVRGSLEGRGTTVGSKTQTLLQWLALLSSPHPSTCLPAHYVSLPARELTFWQINGSGLCQVWVHFRVTGRKPCSFLSSGGQMKSQLHLTTGMRGHIFSTDLHLTLYVFPPKTTKGHYLKILWLKSNFLWFSLPFSNLFFGCLAFEGRFFFFCWGHGGQSALWTSYSVCSQVVCFLTGLCVAGKGRCLLPNVGLADSIKKISKGSLWGAVKKKGCSESGTRLLG